MAKKMVTYEFHRPVGGEINYITVPSSYVMHYDNHLITIKDKRGGVRVVLNGYAPRDMRWQPTETPPNQIL